jgi:uncharacterized protein YndB with AHSA1/START domain
MAARSSAAAESSQSNARELVITRVLDAPRALVWKALTEPERLERWWGPKGFTSRVHKLELRPGGVFLYSQRTPDGREMWGKWVYREIVAPERLVSVSSFTDEKGNSIPHPLIPNWPLEILGVSTFTEHQGKTTMVVRMVPENATELQRKTFEDHLNWMEEGFDGTLEKLGKYLASL